LHSSRFQPPGNPHAWYLCTGAVAESALESEWQTSCCTGSVLRIGGKFSNSLPVLGSPIQFRAVAPAS